MVHIPQVNEKDCPENGHKIKRRRYNVGDPDFKPPDGGWGWLIVFACGFSNLCTFPMFQQFGLVFRQKFRDLGITDTQTTTVINLNSAFNASVGLLNGPVFGTFSYRQVAMFGSLLVATSLFISTMCNSFWMYIIFYAMCYGSGIGITQSANALALNTYFKEKRRIATGLSWSTTALGPIVWPFIITYLKSVYGMQGTLLLFSAFAGHSFMCSLLLQPVNWHTQFREIDDNNVTITVNENEKPLITEPPTPKSQKSRSAFSSQYLHTNNEDDPVAPGYEITDPGTPMMVRANDGWYSNRSQAGSRVSLASSKSKSRVASTGNSIAPSTRPSYNNLSEARSKKNSSLNLDKEGKERKRKSSYNKAAIREENEESHEATIPDEKMVLKSAAQKLKEYEISQKAEEEEIVKKLIQEEERRKREKLKKEDEEDEDPKKKLSIWQKIAIFFDFNLFKDPIYVNLMLGITIANFAELNFSILTPMVLKEFKFGDYQTATFMSLLGATDILVRFFIPFIADKIGWDNKTFFLFGVMNMALGRIILVHTRTYTMSLIVAVMIGAGKGLRTIFMALVIPGHVPLERLPAASGLQLATSGLLFVALGPIVGWIQDKVGTYVITLHILNICTYSTAIAWTIERIISNRKKRLLKEKEKQVSM